MLMTLIAVILAAIYYFFSQTLTIAWDPQSFITLLMVGGVALPALALILNVSLTLPLSRLEQTLIPNLMQTFVYHSYFRFSLLYITFFSLLSFALTPLIKGIPEPYNVAIFVGWLIAFGIGLDCLRANWRRGFRFLIPASSIKVLETQSINAIRDGNDTALWSALDEISEIAARAVDLNKIALSTQAIQAFGPIMKTFYTSAKSIARTSGDLAAKKESGIDEVSYTTFHVVQSLEFINDRALQNRMETVCRQMILLMGKVIMSAARLDLSLVSFPTHFLSKFGLKALQHHFPEVADLTTSTLVEISKNILTETDITYAELQPPFQSILTGLNTIAKETFKKNKNTSIKVLVQPFKDIKEYFMTEKVSKHRDTPSITAAIDGIIAEFETLQEVMNTLPPLSAIMGDVGKSEKP